MQLVFGLKWPGLKNMFGSAPLPDGPAPLRRALDSLQAVIQFDPEGRILDANRSFLAATGYGIEEIKSRHHRIFMRPEDAEAPGYARFWEALRTGAPGAQPFGAGCRCTGPGGSKAPAIIPP